MLWLVFTGATTTLCGMSKAPHSTSGSAPGLPSQVVRRNTALLTKLARKYIWWLPPAEAMNFPARIVTQVMNIGEFDDARLMAASLGDACLRTVVRHAEAGQFNERSWHYWHYRLGLAAPGQVPSLPVRRIG